MAKLLYEEFKINNKCKLNSEDMSTLTLLYLPLIGLDSFGLYCSLTSLEPNNPNTFKRLIDLVNLKTITNLNKALDKLQGIGLLKVYYKNNEDYIFELIRPINEKTFISEESLVALLKTQIGNDEVQKIKDKYKAIPKAYKDITKTMNEVYDISYTNDQTIFNNLLSDEIVINNDEFNYFLFKELVDTNFITEEALNDKELKRMVIRLSFIYKLNEEDLKDVLYKSITYDKRCDYPSLSKYARMRFQEKYKIDTPKLVSSGTDNYIEGSDDDKIITLCNKLELLSPSEVLEDLGGSIPSSADLKIAEELAKNTNLSNGAINFLLMLVNNEKNGELPQYSYFSKIAANWQRAKVKTAYDAYNYIEKRNQGKKDQDIKKKKEIKTPSWYQDYNLSLNQQQEPTKNLDVLAKNLFED